MTYAEENFSPKKINCIESILEEVKKEEFLEEQGEEAFVNRLPVGKRIQYEDGGLSEEWKRRKKEFINEYVNERKRIQPSLVNECLEELNSYHPGLNKMNEFQKSIHWYLLDNDLIEYNVNGWSMKLFNEMEVIKGVLVKYAEYLKAERE